MKKHLLLLLATLAAASFLAAGARNADDVLMTVNGKDIHVSEFEYLYNKNNSQQLEPQTLDQYLDMFINYKLKVADAENAGIQNSPSFIKEFEKFREELSAPYFVDKQVEDSLINASYSHRLSEVLVSHIMLPAEDGSEQRLDSIRDQILAGNITFEDAARQFSIDRSNAGHGGLMGYVVPDRFPWPFEDAAYNTPEGKISPVINSGFGFHIIRTEKIRPAEGEVNASHILLMTRGMAPEQAAKQKERIDSLYNVIAGGGDFAALAKQYSEDPGSAKNGGSLGWFGRGMMVAEFDSTAFALKDGELSKPFSTTFGYHIIKRFDSRRPGALDEATRKEILQKMQNDARGAMPAQARIVTFLSKHNAKVDSAAVAKVADVIRNNDSYDSTAIAQLKALDLAVATYDDKTIKIADVMEQIRPIRSTSVDQGINHVTLGILNAIRTAVLEIERNTLADNNADYRNLINEYRDGILLYEISNRNVWEKASKDTEGLDKFFKANYANYKWDTPKFKSYVIFAKNDSILNEALEMASTISAANAGEFTARLRQKFGHDIKVERVVAAKGENAITDYLGFGAPKPAPDTKARWSVYAAFGGRIIDAPEEASDVRGAAVSDYQTQLEKDWLKQLHKKYKVKVNKKVFEKLKKAHK